MIWHRRNLRENNRIDFCVILRAYARRRSEPSILEFRHLDPSANIHGGSSSTVCKNYLPFYPIVRGPMADCLHVLIQALCSRRLICPVA